MDKYDEVANKICNLDDEMNVDKDDIVAILRESFPESARPTTADELNDLLDRFFVLGQTFAKANQDCESAEYAQYGEQYNNQKNAIITAITSIIPNVDEILIEALDRAEGFLALAAEHLSDADNYDAVAGDLRRCLAAIHDAKDALNTVKSKENPNV